MYKLVLINRFLLHSSSKKSQGWIEDLQKQLNLKAKIATLEQLIHDIKDAGRLPRNTDEAISKLIAEIEKKKIEMENMEIQKNSINLSSDIALFTSVLTRLTQLDNQITKLQDWYERLLSLSKDRSICLKELGKLKKNYIWKVCCYCICSMLVLCIFREIPVLGIIFGFNVWFCGNQV